MTEVLATPPPTGRVGIYVHVPFCARHCPYCDFAIVVASRPPLEQWLGRVVTELTDEAPRWRDRTLQTVYLGGGTPSLLHGRHVATLLDSIRRSFDTTHVSEVTVEANPEHADPALLDAWLGAGVTRVSWGVQSMDPASLALLGRAHGPDDAARAVQLSRQAGFKHVSVDVISALPGRDADDARRDAAAVASLPGIDHVSAYELTFEPYTSLTRRRARGELRVHDEDARAAILAAVVDELAAQGFERYEVSNYARAGGRSAHNASYWAGHEYIGVGPGAHGLRIDEPKGRILRTARTRAFRRWVEAAGPSFDEIESLDSATHLAECAMLALRTSDGLDLDQLAGRFGASAHRILQPLLDAWCDDGLVCREGPVFRPGPRALDLADELAVQILTAVDPYRAG